MKCIDCFKIYSKQIVMWWLIVEKSLNTYTKHFLPTPTLQMHFTSLNKPVHLTKKLNKSKCTSEDSTWFLLNTTKCTCYCLIQPQPPQLQLHENLLKRKINLHVQAKALISFAMHDCHLIFCCILFNALSTPLYTYWLYYQSFLLCFFRLTFCAIPTR